MTVMKYKMQFINMNDPCGHMLTTYFRENNDPTRKAMAHISLLHFFLLNSWLRYTRVYTNALCKEYRRSESVARCRVCLS